MQKGIGILSPQGGLGGGVRGASLTDNSSDINNVQTGFIRSDEIRMWLCNCGFQKCKLMELNRGAIYKINSMA